LLPFEQWWEFFMRIDVQCANPKQPTFDDVARAFIELADRIDRQGFADLYDDDGCLTFTWIFPNGELTDEELFADMVGRGERHVVPALRRLLQSYLAADKNYAEAWADEEGMAAFTYALRALILLDPVQSRELLLDCIENMPMHVQPTLHTILSAFVEKHGFKSRNNIRLGLAMIFREHRGYSDLGTWDNYGLLSQAAQLMTGAEFGEDIIAVIESEHARSVRRVHERKGDQTWQSELRDDQCLSDIVFLLSAVPKDTFGLDLRKKLSERWDVTGAEKARRDEHIRLMRSMGAMHRGDVVSGMRDLLDPGAPEALRAAGIDYDALVAELEADLKN
jgi:hypothetical protein